MRRGEQPPWIVPDGLWQRIEPLLPKPERNPRHPGRKRIPDRQVLCGILFVLHTGIQWEFLPQQHWSGSAPASSSARSCRSRAYYLPIRGEYGEDHKASDRRD